MNLDTTEDDKFLTDPQICADLNISSMTLWRWERLADQLKRVARYRRAST